MTSKAASGTTHKMLDFLGSAHVFASALTDVMERHVVSEVSRGELTFEQMKVVQLIGKTDRHNVSDVAAFMRVSNAAASKTVDKLVRAKLLRRGEGATDRRATHLHLTPAGSRMLANYDALRLKAIAKIWEEIPPGEIEKLGRTLDRLSARIVDHVTKAGDICLQCGIHLPERCVLHEEAGSLCPYRKRRSRAEA